MWVIAFLGMATGYAESLLGQVYKVRDSNGEFRGGPAYYIKQGLGLGWLGIAFSVCLLFGYGFIFGACLLYTSPSPRDATLSRMPSSA